MTDEGGLKIFSSMQYRCVGCGSKNIRRLDGTKLNGIEVDNRTCHDCGIMMIIQEKKDYSSL